MKKNLIIMVGCPGAGKSTYIKNMNMSNSSKIISRDILRSEMFGHSEKCVLDRDSEYAITKREISDLIRSLRDNKTEVIIIDDTNLKSKSIRRWIGIARQKVGESDDLTITMVKVTAPLETILERRGSEILPEILKDLWEMSEELDLNKFEVDIRQII